MLFEVEKATLTHVHIRRGHTTRHDLQVLMLLGRPQVPNELSSEGLVQYLVRFYINVWYFHCFTKITNHLGLKQT